MKKIIILLVSTFVMCAANVFAKDANNAIATDICNILSNEESETFVDQVRAINATGSQSVYFNVYYRPLAHGKYYYFAVYSGREYEISYSSSNNCFSVYFNGDRWYFSNRNLELLFFSTKPSYNK